MFFSRRDWCCLGLKRAFEYRNESGIYVFAELPHELLGHGASFWMGMRSIDVGDPPIKLVPSNDPGLICIETTLPIKFCPWCGCRLARFYRKTFRQLYDANTSARHGWNPPSESRPTTQHLAQRP